MDAAGASWQRTVIAMALGAPILADLTVLELGGSVSGAYCGKLLAGLGARVIKIESPAGGSARLQPPFAGDTPDPERSLSFLYLNTGKQSVTLDLDQAGARKAFLSVLADADVLLESFRPGTLDSWGLGYAALSRSNSGIVVASITPFGQAGPYRDYLTNEIVAEAMGGLLFTIGLPSREPLKMGGNPALCTAGAATFSAVLAAIWQRDRTGMGQQIDVSIQEATAVTQIHASIEATWQGTDTERTAGDLIEAADGWASAGLDTGVSAQTWPEVCAILGRPELVDDPRFINSAARRENRAVLNDVVRDWVKSQAKEDIYHRLQGLRSIAGYVATTADVYRSKQLIERGFFTEIDHPVAGRALYPGPPFRIGDQAAVQGRAPLLGEHNRELLRDWSKTRPEARAAPAVRGAPSGNDYALSDIRILDLTQVAVGPYATFLLSSLGAEVIKVESNRRPDTTRGPVQPTLAQQMRQYPRGVPGERPWNRTAYFNQRNRGKLGITLDFSQPAGRELFKLLATRCDALIENFRASVMERQGLSWEVLHRVNPRLVYLKLSSQGNSGPERDYGSLGSTLEQTAGLASITGYLDGPPLLTNRVYPDPVAGVTAVGAVIAGLRQAKRTGEGQLIDFSQREQTVGLIGEALLDYAFNGRVQGPIGNRSPSSAPQGVYPCAGDDRWIAIAAESDEQWAALTQLMGAPAWSAEPAMAGLEGRRAAHDAIDARIAEWTRGFDHHDLMHRLQRAGVAAGAVLTGRELLADPQLEARGWWEELVPPEVGEKHRFVTAPWRLSASPFRPSAPAPLLGQHNDEVYREFLGLEASEYDDLKAAGVIGTEPLWARA